MEGEIDVVKSLVKVCILLLHVGESGPPPPKPYLHTRTHTSSSRSRVSAGGLRGLGEPPHPPHSDPPTLPFHPGRLLLSAALPRALLHPGPGHSCLPAHRLPQNNHAQVHGGPGQQPPIMGLRGQLLQSDAGRSAAQSVWKA